jgi:hypothetical protein
VSERFARARLRYDTMVSAQRLPTATEVEVLRAELASVPPGSKYGPEAARLIRALEHLRSRVRAPLALGNRAADSSSELSTQLQHCAHLAKSAGLDGGVDTEALRLIEACRRQAEKLELEFAHGSHDAGP